MNSIENIITLLKKNIKNTNKNKSSYWKFHLENSNYNEIYNQLNFGNYTKKNFLSFMHYIMQRLIFDKEIFKSDIYTIVKSEFNNIKRVPDFDTIKHVALFCKLKNICNPKSICIIGDGKLNGILTANAAFPEAKLFNVNLSETLINDLLILQKLNSSLKNNIKFISSYDDNTSDQKLNIVPSNFKETLAKRNIDLFINIASFQEMPFEEIEKYFKIIKTCKSLLYSCNREVKHLEKRYGYGGEKLEFNKYPWGNYNSLFWEICPWYKKTYSFRPPFIIKNMHTIIHCLVDYSHLK